MMSYIGKIITYISQENIFVHGKTKQKTLDFSSCHLSFNEHIWNTYDLPEQNRLHFLGKARHETDTFEKWQDCHWLQWVGQQ